MEGPTSISDLLKYLKVEAPRVAVELNLEIVPKAQFDAISVNEGDRVEVVSFVGGG